MNAELPRIETATKTGDEPFHADRENRPQTLLDYWRWAGPDLVSNAQRGILGEFLVGSALQMTDRVRREWDAYDVRMPSGLTVEVKTSAYIQSWAQTDYSRIQFDIAPHKSWDAKDNTYDSVNRRSADVYVFSLLAHRDQNSIDPLNVNHWEFYVLATSVLDERCGEQKTIQLGPLKALKPEQSTYDTLLETVKRIDGRPNSVECRSGRGCAQWRVMADGAQLMAFNPTLVSGLRSLPVKVLDDDFDIFGDGKVKIINAPGHTPGHQVLYLELENFGPLILSGDLYHLQINRSEKRVPTFNVDADQTLQSMHKVEKLVTETGAVLWIEHELALFKTPKTAPAYYD